MKRAAHVEELEPLLALCRTGRLFEAQAWIQQGKPVALPEGAPPRFAPRNPLRVAMATGFHSIVQVLLEAGAPVREGRYEALEDAVAQRRPDLAALLLEHGASVHDVSMRHVLEAWQPEMIELFLSHGASLVRHKPIAWGLIHRTRPTLGLFKRFVKEQPELMHQANLALRFHAREGHAQGVALLLWAGADPWARGPSELGVADEEDEDDSRDGSSAVRLAALYGHVDILRNKKMRIEPDAARPETLRLLEAACYGSDNEVLSLLLERGHRPQDLPDAGTHAIDSLLHAMTWEVSTYRIGAALDPISRGLDTSRARERMKMLHILVAAGAKWVPEDKRAIGNTRQCLLKLARPYVLEFVWLMQAYGAARRSDVQDLLRTEAMVRLLAHERARADSLVARIPAVRLDRRAVTWPRVRLANADRRDGPRTPPAR